MIDVIMQPHRTQEEHLPSFNTRALLEMNTYHMSMASQPLPSPLPAMSSSYMIPGSAFGFQFYDQPPKMMVVAGPSANVWSPHQQYRNDARPAFVMKQDFVIQATQGAAEPRPHIKREYRKIPIASLLNHDNINGDSQAVPFTTSNEEGQQPQLKSSSASNPDGSSSEPQTMNSTSSHESAMDHERTARKRNRWSPEQDEALIQVVNKYGAKDWSHIATFFPGRNADNVRLRYKYFLQYPQEVRDKQFSSEEDAIILKEAQGSRQWKKIGHQMGRSCGAVRNRFDVLRRSAKREERKAMKLAQKQERMVLRLKQIQDIECKNQ